MINIGRKTQHHTIFLLNNSLQEFWDARKAPDGLGKLLALGLTCLILVQAIVNMGVATVILPTTGATLPFISYGGSSLIVCLTAVGILLNISKNRDLAADSRR